MFIERRKMMRKLLILMLVLGMASMANAALSLVVDGVESGSEITIATTDTIWIGVYDDTGGGKFIGAVILEEESFGVPEAGGSWTGGNAVYIPPALATASNSRWGNLTGYGDIWYLSNTDPTTNMMGVGLHAAYEFHCDVDQDDVTVSLRLNDLTTVLDTLTIHQIPEPMTMALLGVGALLLRRRK
jgi:hypothetical protein